MKTELKTKEKEVLKLTSNLWSAIIELEKYNSIHPDDIHEHRRDIHNIQNRILSRPIIRKISIEKQLKRYENENSNTGII